MKTMGRVKGSAITMINWMFLLLTVVTLAFSMYNYLMYRDIGERYRRSTDLYYEAAAVKDSIKQCDITMEDYLLSRNRGSLAEHNEAVKTVDAGLRRCRDLVDTPAVASFIQSITDAFSSYQTEANYSAFSYAESNYYEGSLSFQESREIGKYIQEYCDEILTVLLTANQDYYEWLNRKQSQLFFINLYAVILLAAAAGYSVYYVNDRFYRPLNEIYRASLKIAGGEMVQVREDWQDRMIKIQAAAFNKMSRSIVRMMDDIQKHADIRTKLLDEQLKNEQYVHRLEQADFLNLQLQTNPHFLFNTLNTISRTVTLGMSDEAVEMIDAMAAMLRYNLKDMEEPVSLEEEIQVVKEYLHIQNFRFRDRIRAEFDYEKELAEQVTIPRFSLQPFAENAVIHGLEPKTEPGVVRIELRMEGENCVVSIADSGVGIPADKLEALIQRKQIGSGKRKSIGIMNTIDRLKFFTKLPEPVEIESEWGKGTIVRIYLPLEISQGPAKPLTEGLQTTEGTECTS